MKDVPGALKGPEQCDGVPIEFCWDISVNDAFYKAPEKTQAGFIAGGSNSDTIQSTYENIYNTTGTYVVKDNSELSDDETSVVDEDVIFDQMIYIADAMNFIDDENEDSDVDMNM